MIADDHCNYIKILCRTWIVLIFLAISIVAVNSANADLGCNACHTMPPSDTVSERNPATGAFKGNHAGHSSASASSCTPCHGSESAVYTAAHSTELLSEKKSPIIKITPIIHNYSTPNGRARYTRGTYFNQTSIPPNPLGICSNVNCHFENATPAWGTAIFDSPADCDKCHGAPPSAIDPGSHAKHADCYPGVANCQKCHSNNTTFQHATSAGNRALNVSFAAAPNNGSGSYTGPLNDYLPSQTNVFGVCSATYCHGTTMNVAGDRNGGTNITPTWGTASTGQCGTCHGADATNPPHRGSHQSHTGLDRWYYGAFPNYIYARGFTCTVCHKNFTPKHVDGNADWSFDSTGKPWLSGALYKGFSSAFALPVPSAYGQCSNLYCHSIVQTITGGALTGLAGEYKTPTWGNVSEGKCGSCHAIDAQHAWYAGLQNGTPEIASGSHARHLKYLDARMFAGIPERCAVCHDYSRTDNLSGCAAATCHTTEQAMHVNGSVDVRFPTTLYGATASYSGSPTPGDGFGGCTSTYCHSDGRATLPTYYTPTWGDVASGACGTCHGVTSIAPPASTPHAKHLGSVKPYLFACSVCHSGNVQVTVNSAIQPAFSNLTSHVNLLRDVKFDSNSVFGTYSSVSQSCRNLYCHSAGNLNVTAGALPAAYNGKVYARQTWSGVLSCNSCHGRSASNGMPDYSNGGAATATANSHPKHVSSSSIACVECHEKTTKNSTTIRNTVPSKHVNGITNDVFFNLSGHSASSTYNNTRKRCYNAYCHSNGSKSNGPFLPYSTAAWGGTVGCAGCHQSTPNTGSHNPHVTTTYGVPVACYKCHAATVNSGMTISSAGNHVNKRINIAFNSTTTAVFGKYSGHLTPMQKNPGSGYANCENVYCHSSGQGLGGSWPPTYSAPKWGGATTGKCGSCHGDGYHSVGNKIISGSHDKHMSYGFTTGDVTGCVICHYGTGFASQACTQCHFGSDALTTLHVNHQVDVSFISKYGGAYNGTPSPGDGYSTCTNSYCHSSGVSVTTGTVPANTSAAWGSGVLACSGCHGNPPTYANNSPKKNSHGIHAAYGCNKCHYRTTTNGTSITNTTNHVNKAYDVYSGAGARFTYVYNAGGGTCNSISCHGTTTAQWGSSACLGCHSVAQGNRAAITSQFNANSHHIQGTITDAKCYQCHWEAKNDGTIDANYHGGSAAPGSTVDLVVYGAGRPAAYSLTGTVTAVKYTANNTRGEIAKINTHCLGCHSTANNAAQPFGDGKTPKQYAWDGKSVADRYTNSDGTQWGKYGTNGKSGVSKAFSAHGNAVGNAGGFDTANGVDGAITNTRGGGSNVYCFDCHNSHGSTVTGITTSYVSATTNGGILKDTVAGKGGYAIAYKPYSGGSTASKNKRNPGASLCFDCHMTPDATAGIKPWGYASTFGASKAIIGYWDTPYFGAGQFPSQARFNYKNSVNMGGHYGKSGALSSQASNTINGLCTPCHDPHGISSTLGANMHYAVPLLKGTFMTSPYNEDVAPAYNLPRTAAENAIEYHIDQNTFASDITLSGVAGGVSGIQQADTQFAGLCLQCHAKAGLTNGANGGAWKSVDRIHESVKGWGANTKHNYSCSKCHTPHNSRLPKLMVSNCFNTKHKGRVADNLSPATSGGWNGCRSGEGWWDYEFGCGNDICSNSWGSMPGSYSQNPPDWEYSGAPQHSNRTVNCHQGQEPDQRWNEKTRW